MRESMQENNIHRANQAIAHKRAMTELQEQQANQSSQELQPGAVMANMKAGFTRIPNNLEEYNCQVELSDRQHRILRAVIRKTYGFNKAMDWLAAEQISQLISYKGHITHVRADVRELLKRKIFIQEDKLIGPNPILSEWVLSKSKNVNKVFKPAQHHCSSPHTALSAGRDDLASSTTTMLATLKQKDKVEKTDICAEQSNYNNSHQSYDATSQRASTPSEQTSSSKNDPVSTVEAEQLMSSHNDNKEPEDLFGNLDDIEITDPEILAFINEPGNGCFSPSYVRQNEAKDDFYGNFAHANEFNSDAASHGRAEWPDGE